MESITYDAARTTAASKLQTSSEETALAFHPLPHTLAETLAQAGSTAP